MIRRVTAWTTRPRNLRRGNVPTKNVSCYWGPGGGQPARFYTYVNIGKKGENAARLEEKRCSSDREKMLGAWRTRRKERGSLEPHLVEALFKKKVGDVRFCIKNGERGKI